MISALMALWMMGVPGAKALPHVEVKDLQVCFDAKGEKYTTEVDARDSLRTNATFQFNDYLRGLKHGGMVRGLLVSEYKFDSTLLDANNAYRYDGRVCVDLGLYSPYVGDAVLEDLDPVERLSATSYLRNKSKTTIVDGKETTQKHDLTINFTNRALPWVDDFRRVIGDYGPSWELCASRAGRKTGEGTYVLDKKGITRCYDTFLEVAKGLKKD